jgi:hypothetical protein
MNMIYEIYTQEPSPQKICLGYFTLSKDGEALAVDKEGEVVVSRLLRARVGFVCFGRILISGFEEVGQDETGQPKFRYQEWWLRYADAVDPHAPDAHENN